MLSPVRPDAVMERQKPGRHDMKSYFSGAEFMCHNLMCPSSENLCKICAFIKHLLDTRNPRESFRFKR